MALSAIVLTTGLLAIGPQWALIDLPYPEVTGAETAPATLDVRIFEAVTNYARAKAPGRTLPGKPDIAPLKVDGDNASLRVSFGDRSEVVFLVRVRNEWRVVQALTEAREH